MTIHHIDVLAVGNAIVDVFVQCDDNFLVVNKIDKGNDPFRPRGIGTALCGDW